jgi:hypothetical protein
VFVQEQAGQHNGNRGIQRTEDHGSIQASDLLGAHKKCAAGGVEAARYYGQDEHRAGNYSNASAKQNYDGSDNQRSSSGKYGNPERRGVAGLMGAQIISSETAA